MWKMSKYNFIHLVAMLLLMITTTFGAASAFNQQDNPLVLDNQQEKYVLDQHLEIFRDESRNATIDGILNGEFEKAFLPNDDETPNFGFQTVPYWVRFQVKNNSDLSGWVLTLNFINMQFMDVYFIPPDSGAYTLKPGGIQRPFEDRDYPINYHAFDVYLPPGSDQLIIIRFENQAAMTLPLTLWSADAFSRQTFSNQFVYGLFYGILGIMFFYNLGLWFFVRDRNYLYLSSFIFWMFIILFFYDGMAAKYIQMNFDRLSGKMVVVGIGFAMFFIFKFVNNVLDIKLRSPLFQKVRRAIEASFLVYAVVAMLLPYTLSARIGMVSVIFLFVCILIISIYLSLQHRRSAYFLLISLIVIMIGNISISLTRLGYLPSTPLTEYTLRAGLVWMVVFWSITLADKIKTMESAVNNVNRELLANQERLTQYLDAMPVGVTVYDTDMKPKFFNKRAEAMMTNPNQGLTSDMTIGSSLEDTIKSLSIHRPGTQQPYPILETAVVKSLKGESASADDFEIDMGDRHLLFQAWANPIIDAQKKIEGAIVAFQDITKEREIEDALRRSEDRFRTLVETMYEGLGVVNEDNSITYVNPSLSALLGYSTGEMLGRTITEFALEAQKNVIEEQLTTVKSGTDQISLVTWHKKDEGYLHSHVSFAGIFDKPKEYRGAIFIITDISEQIEASKVLEERVAERTHELSSLLEVSREISGTLEIEPLLELIFEALHTSVDFAGAAFYALEDKATPIYSYLERTYPQLPIKKIGEIDNFLKNIVEFRANEAVIISDIQIENGGTDEYRKCTSLIHDLPIEKIRSWMGVPITYKDHLIGIFSIIHHVPGAFTPEKAKLVQAIASQTAIAIENSRLFQQAQLGAAIQERSRLSRELHDSVTQALYTLMLYAEASRLALTTGKVDSAKNHLEEVVNFSREAMRDLRLLIFELRPTILTEEGFVAALQSRLEAVEKRSGCKTECLIQGEPNLSPEVETQLYWVVHEALNNVLKHSHASNVYLDVNFSEDLTTIIIRDDGIGFDARNIGLTSGMGMKSISERVKRLDGSFKIETKHGEGTILKIIVGNT